jgi:hypothetical protein
MQFPPAISPAQLGRIRQKKNFFISLRTIPKMF